MPVLRSGIARILLAASAIGVVGIAGHRAPAPTTALRIQRREPGGELGMTDAWRAPSFLAASSIDDSVGNYAVGVFADRGLTLGR